MTKLSEQKVEVVFFFFPISFNAKLVFWHTLKEENKKEVRRQF